jgi:hypothetical protein
VNEQCANCRFFVKNKLCIRYPPVFNASGLALFSQVPPDGRCGEWKKAAPSEPQLQPKP